jgi:hypothetical protein
VEDGSASGVRALEEFRDDLDRDRFPTAGNGACEDAGRGGVTVLTARIDIPALTGGGLGFIAVLVVPALASAHLLGVRVSWARAGAGRIHRDGGDHARFEEDR